MIGTLGRVLEEHADLVGRHQVADVLRLRQLTENYADDPAFADGRSTAVAGVQRGIDLDPQPIIRVDKPA